MFQEIAGVENLLEAWREFLRGKRDKSDVQEFGLRLMDNIFMLHRDLLNHTYRHGGYQAFTVSDPKPRNIHKASVRDRLLHHAVYRILYPYFDQKFVADSFSCRIGKGTHRALNRFRTFGYMVSKNNTRTCWVLQCDIKRFFATMHHATLLSILEREILDRGTLWLCEQIISSFTLVPRRGLPLGNLTSQLFANVYLDPFDQFVKHVLKEKHYMRYADDFVLLSDDRERLTTASSMIRGFLGDVLQLRLHEDKARIKTLASGIDFLGWVHFPNHRVLRASTKRRMMKKMQHSPAIETAASYRGLLRHGNMYKLMERIFKRTSPR